MNDAPHPARDALTTSLRSEFEKAFPSPLPWAVRRRRVAHVRVSRRMGVEPVHMICWMVIDAAMQQLPDLMTRLGGQQEARDKSHA